MNRAIKNNAQDAITELDNIRNDMTVGFDRGLKRLRWGMYLMWADLPFAILRGPVANLTWLIVFLFAIGLSLLGSRTCHVASRNFDTAIADFEARYEV